MIPLQGYAFMFSRISDRKKFSFLDFFKQEQDIIENENHFFKKLNGDKNQLNRQYFEKDKYKIC